jgi:hypothetical protein
VRQWHATTSFDGSFNFTVRAPQAHRALAMENSPSFSVRLDWNVG